ncbi:VWA domain-containing protein [Cryobacterium sp. PAMC25264]|uniref:VWA domain-containing protein n=1 Tax=Cryobacterium sp. PAMC25264 TaxID=2861288 RepID=UPI001C62FCFB|nr:VWA domain-containing protein [Cryobacterium sp. PAMC25264]QYF73354.1 VWA domain-containing protein [Cryobacterium sp. PAMC25264]
MRKAPALSPDQRAAWQSAQALWGVELHDPELKPDAQAPSFAWFSFPPQVTFDLPLAERMGVGSFLESIFAHEIGHHALSPSTRLIGLKIQHQLARAFTATDAARIPNVQDEVHNFSNLWSDMLINVRVAELQRRRDGQATPPEMVRMWTVLGLTGTADRMWWVILRAYEILWVLAAGSLCAAEPPLAPINPVQEKLRARAQYSTAVHRKIVLDKLRATGTAHNLAEQEQEFQAQDAADDVQREFDALALTDPRVDAGLLAETVRTFGDDPVSGALRFGMLLAPYLVTPNPGAQGRAKRGSVPVRRAGLCDGESGATPATAGELVAVLGDARLRDIPEHPAVLKARTLAAKSTAADGIRPAVPGATAGASVDSNDQGYGLARTLELYRDSGANAVIAAWYQTRARSYVRPLLQRSPAAPPAGTEIPGALESWQLGDDLADLDWAASMAQNPTIVPGVTTVHREYLPDLPPVATVSLDLDLYIDSSGSMRSPLLESPAVLAGSILILSVLRGGGRVRVTSFSAAGQVAGGARFTRERLEALRDLTTYFGGGTVFPLDLYRDRYRGLGRTSATVRRHVVVLSDEGLLSMFGTGQPEFADVAARVRRGLDTATLILQDSRRLVAAPAAAAGYDVEYIERMDDAPDACARLARRLATSAPRSPNAVRGGFRG